jgi:hypothetical protein
MVACIISSEFLSLRTDDLRSGTVRVYLETDKPPVFGKEVIHIRQTLLRPISSYVQMLFSPNSFPAEKTAIHV